ncbi:hypothetical protein GWK47_046954 [Chionoecetes opilio]|uniref:Uncharacterized protein n=1 Tax=Chionoecetes opilio TaxID=41210 RepID=A0A8J4Y539_CHIOP|nr:hypothetical protein GWK47_046954 [Chionoecetes opilio]
MVGGGGGSTGARDRLIPLPSPWEGSGRGSGEGWHSKSDVTIRPISAAHGQARGRGRQGYHKPPTEPMGGSGGGGGLWLGELRNHPPISATRRQTRYTPNPPPGLGGLHWQTRTHRTTRTRPMGGYGRWGGEWLGELRKQSAHLSIKRGRTRCQARDALAGE